MHSVKMIPFATPYKSIFFEHIHNALRDFVNILNRQILVGAFTFPFPVVGFGNVNINGYPKAVHALPFSARNVPPVECAGYIGKILLPFGV